MTIYDYEVLNQHQEPVSLSHYKDKVLLIVNTATQCGLTPQYEGLEALYQKYKDSGFEILDFPSNQFKQAAESDAEIQSFCTLTYNTTFPRFAKIAVNGKNEEPLYRYLKKEARSGILGSAIKWNFTKFLVNREGEVVDRFAPTEKPEHLEKAIESVL